MEKILSDFCPPLQINDDQVRVGTGEDRAFFWIEAESRSSGWRRSPAKIPPVLLRPLFTPSLSIIGSMPSTREGKPLFTKHHSGAERGEKYSTRLTATSETNITPV